MKCLIIKLSAKCFNNTTFQKYPLEKKQLKRLNIILQECIGLQKLVIYNSAILRQCLIIISVRKMNNN